MRILFMTGRELGYTRNDVLLRAFRRFADVDMVGTDRKPASLLLNSARVGLKALPRLLSGKYDLVFAGFYGHLLMLPAGLLRRKPILFDAFVSTFDTLSSDRQAFGPRSLPGRAAWLLDRTACRLADHVLLDTPLHADYFRDTFHLAAEKLSAIPVGCNDELFYPRAVEAAGPPVRVLYYSSYLPLHGAEIVVRAAALLRDLPVVFQLIGSGQEFAQVHRLTAELAPDRVEFLPFLPLEELPARIAGADICLGGHFGGSEKAGRVVPGKVYQILAMGGCLVAGDTPANRELLTAGEHALLCPPCDPAALAEAIRTLAADPEYRRRLASAGRKRYETTSSEAAITVQLQAVCTALLDRKPGG